VAPDAWFGGPLVGVWVKRCPPSGTAGQRRGPPCPWAMWHPGALEDGRLWRGCARCR